MAHQRVEVLWSPNNADEFATYCTELRLHSVQVREEGVGEEGVGERRGER